MDAVFDKKGNNGAWASVELVARRGEGPLSNVRPVIEQSPVQMTASSIWHAQPRS